MSRMVIFGLPVLLVAACAPEGHRHPELRAALDKAQLSLGGAVGVALRAARAGAATEATLALGTSPTFLVATAGGTQVQVDALSAAVMGMAPVTEAQPPCPGSIPLADALGIAESAASGDAVSVAPDDDDGCAREVQVLSADILYEVNVGMGGEVLEQELSDELSGGER